MKCEVISTGGKPPDSQMKYWYRIWFVLQPPIEAAATGSEPKEELQYLCTHLVKKQVGWASEADGNER